jgi:hypothetical protein
VLNQWIREKVAQHANYVDIGANNGYHTFGFAHAARRAGHHQVRVIAVEPEVTDELIKPLDWPMYSACDIRIIAKFCGTANDKQTLTVLDLLEGLDEALIKVDIEGAERDILTGAGAEVADPRFDWCIEIHGEELIPVVAQNFCAAGRPFLLRSEEKLPFLSREARSITTTWLTTI